MDGQGLGVAASRTHLLAEGSCRQEVPRAQVAAAGCVMRYHLGQGPVEGGQVTPGDGCGLQGTGRQEGTSPSAMTTTALVHIAPEHAQVLARHSLPESKPYLSQL